MPTAIRTAPLSHCAPVLAIILVSYLMIVLDISVVITALPKIHHALDFSATGLSWVQNTYTLAFGGLLLLGARAGDILGRRRMFVAGADAIGMAEQKAAELKAQIDAWRGLSTSLAIDEADTELASA
jgi:MFS family permease